MGQVGVADAALAAPRLRGRLHQLGFVIAVPAGILLVVAARGVTERIAAILFGLSLLALLIASSYTPVSLLALDPAWGITFLVVAWGIAAGGATLALWHMRIIRRFAVV